jgi:hypothetical protein
LFTEVLVGATPRKYELEPNAILWFSRLKLPPVEPILTLGFPPLSSAGGTNIVESPLDAFEKLPVDVPKS